jgi:hypothetical protein
MNGRPIKIELHGSRKESDKNSNFFSFLSYTIFYRQAANLKKIISCSEKIEISKLVGSVGFFDV